MSDVPRGEGWWQASDGRFYPPELHPSRPAATQPSQPVTLAGDPDASWFAATSSAPWVAEPNAGKTDRRQGRRFTILIVGAAVLLVAVGLIVAVTSGGGNGGPSSPSSTGAGGSANGVGTGAGTFRITWHTEANGAGQSNPQPFTGVIGGTSVQGIAHPLGSALGSGAVGPTPSIPSTIDVATWSGTYAGRPFHLQLSVTLRTLGFVVHGTYGNEAVSVTAQPNVTARRFSFNGTVGTSQVSGTVSNVVRTGDTEVATGTYRVQ